MGSQIIMGSALKIVVSDRSYVKTCQLRQARAHSYAALKLLYIPVVEMGKEFKIGEEFNHRGLYFGRICLGRKRMRVDARVSQVE
jgi:hypothetical protein